MATSFRLAGGEEGEEDSQWRLYFKLYCFLDVESMPKEGVEFVFMFEQVSAHAAGWSLLCHHNTSAPPAGRIGNSRLVITMPSQH